MDLFQRFRPSGRSPLPFALLVGLLLFLGIMGVRKLGWLELLELSAYDYFLGFRIRGAPPEKDIILIKITEDDIQHQGQWPLTDAQMAMLLEKVDSYHPRVIGLDIYRDIPVSPGKEKLAGIFDRWNNIITVKKIGDDSHPGVREPYMVQDPGMVGFNDIPVDPDGVIRRGLLFLDDGETVYSSFSLLMAAYYLREQGISPEPGEPDPANLKLGKKTFVPLKPNDGGYAAIDTRGYQYLIDFIGGPFRSYSLSDILSGKMSTAALRDKIVIIGVTSESMKDSFLTPIGRTSHSEGTTYGVEIHAVMASQIIRLAEGNRATVAPVKELYEWFWVFLWILPGIASGMRIRSLIRFFLSVTVMVLLLVLSTYLLFSLGWWLPIVPTAISSLGSTALTTAFMSYREKQERNLLMQLFSRHVSQDVAESIWQQRDSFLSHGRPLSRKLVATVLFSDMKGFTSISEKLDPQTLMDWLNEYMESMARTITLNKGVINKYIGDAIMAVFGVPVARESESEIGRDAVGAVQCALAMGKELERLNSEWAERNLPVVRIRVGIFTGPLVAGSLGSSDRMEYTVIGDTVNIASRLESLDKDDMQRVFDESLCRVLIGESTLRYLSDNFMRKKVGEVSLKGKEEKISVYQVLGLVEK